MTSARHCAGTDRIVTANLHIAPAQVTGNHSLDLPGLQVGRHEQLFREILAIALVDLAHRFRGDRATGHTARVDPSLHIDVRGRRQSRRGRPMDRAGGMENEHETLAVECTGVEARFPHRLGRHKTPPTRSTGKIVVLFEHDVTGSTRAPVAKPMGGN